MLNEEQMLKAQSLGNQFKANREQHNLSLNEVSTKLNIRSVLLNDMEKGRFLHLKRGDCMAYAKFLDMDFKEVSDIIEGLEQANISTNASSQRIKVYIGAATAIVIALLVVVGLSISVKNSEDKTRVINDAPIVENSTEVNSGEELLELKEQTSEDETKPIVEVTETQNIKDEKPVEDNFVATSNTISEPNTATVDAITENKVSSGVEIVNIDASIPESSSQNTEVAVKDEAKAQTTEKATEAVKPKVEEKLDVVNKTANEKPAAIKETPKAKNNTPVQVKKNDSVKTVNKPQAPKVSNEAKKTTNLKVGQVVSLGSSSKATEVKPNKAKPTVKEVKTSVVKNNVGSVAPLKSGEIRSLVSSKDQAPTVSSSKTSQNMVSPKILNKEEIKQKADQVVITEAVSN